jgi:uncharacterized protein (TIGR00266 family)
MRVAIEYSPAYAIANIGLDAGEGLRAEAGAMVAMSTNMEMETKAQGGVLGGLKRMALGGESFFVNTYTAQGGPGEVTVGPSLPGDVIHLPLSGHTVFVQSGSYLACGTGIEVDTKWGGAKTFFSSEGLFMLKCAGTGELILSSYGAVKTLDLAQGQTHIMDTGHMVAFSEGTGYEVQKVGGWKSTLLSGEGLVVKLTGPGRVWMQTRSPSSFISWLVPQLPTQRA